MRKSIIISIVIMIVISLVSVNYSVKHKHLSHTFRNQYERLAKSFSKGHLYIDEKVDKKLTKLSNPYDPVMRMDFGSEYLFDYSYYKGHYYVYFGVVPVLVSYLPYRLITGGDLYCYHSICLFICLFIVGIFLLFKIIRDCFFKDMTLVSYLLFSICASFSCIWLMILNPILYFEAIVSGMCFSVWSLLFWFKACFEDNSEKKELLFLTLGNFCGALVFGCRPPIGFFNLLIIPILLLVIKKRKICFKRIVKLLLTFLPYIIVFMLLFLYNYLRFDNPFEFGKTYQFSLVDSTSYISLKDYGFKRLMYMIDYFYFIFYSFLSVDNGLFISYPILLLNFSIVIKRVWKELLKNKMLLFMIFLIVSTLIICILDSIYNFRLVSRYRMDICFLLFIGSYICFGMFRNTINNKKIYDIFIILLCLLTLFISIIFLLFSFGFIHI